MATRLAGIEAAPTTAVEAHWMYWASNATSLAQYIQWASTAVVGAASMPASRVQRQGESLGNIPLPDLPPTLLDPIGDVGPVVW
jgi:hypothetical protein